jgi:hypothetical protein
VVLPLKENYYLFDNEETVFLPNFHHFENQHINRLFTPSQGKSQELGWGCEQRGEQLRPRYFGDCVLSSLIPLNPSL